MDILVHLDNIRLNARDTIQKDTPLHKAVQYDEKDIALVMVDTLLQAGADPRYSKVL